MGIWLVNGLGLEKGIRLGRDRVRVRVKEENGVREEIMFVTTWEGASVFKQA